MYKKSFVPSAIVILAAIVITAGFFFTHSQSPKSTAETYTVIANETDGPEQIFEKAFNKYSDRHSLKVTSDELRQVAEYMAVNDLNGKAYWTDANGIRHNLWIGTGDVIVFAKDTSTFEISNAITDNQKKTIVVNFGFDKANQQLNIIRNQASLKSN